MRDGPRSPLLPAHAEGTVDAIARLHADHRKRATPFQALIASLTARVGRPVFIAWLTIAIVGWMTLNLIMLAIGREPLDAPPFGWLELVASLAALVITVMILSTQRRDDELAGQREQLTLELAILSEQKSAKIIALLEELRRDTPTVRDRVDPEAAMMATPSDPHAVLHAIQDTHHALVSEQPQQETVSSGDSDSRQ